MVRKEPKINNIECKLNQFVDDIQIFVSDISSIDATFCLYRNIEIATGARINLEKTEGLWLSNYRGRKDTPGNIKWTSDSVKILGVHVGNLDLSVAN